MIILRALTDIRVAFALLTRLPLPHPKYDAQATRPMARAAWAYPLVGVVVGLIAGAVGWGLHDRLRLPVGISAVASLLAMIALTGAMHEDGLADCADGFWGAWDPARRLEIMKDSQIGSYGTIALVLSLLLRWYYFTLLFGFGLFFAPLIIAGTASRVGMVVVMQALPNARSGGLSDQTGKPGWSAVCGAIVIALIVGLMTVGGMRTLAAFLCLTVFGTGIALLARAKIGGQTGDVLGATQQIGEIAILVLMLELLGP